MTILDRIVDYKKAEVAASKAEKSRGALERDLPAAPPLRDFFGALAKKRADAQPGLIAEVKKASPSKGLIRADFDPAAIAGAYERGGAACLSVLTDAPSFQGSAEALIAAREATSLPVLRKDFMVDPYQVPQSRLLGADCILIILACTSDGLAAELAASAKSFGMAALFEVHDHKELDRALTLDAQLIGINNRDLRTFETRLEITEALAPLVPRDRLVVSESGIFSAADIMRLTLSSASAFLVGESLMREQDIERATRALLRPLVGDTMPAAAQ
jgi:indole-3-glycerol phosphate synthase